VTDVRKIHLATDIERAIANYLGIDGFNSSEFPDLAGCFADLVAAVHINPDMVSPTDVVENARYLMDRLAQLHSCLAVLVE
jgi:hypothetical protein